MDEPSAITPFFIPLVYTYLCIHHYVLGKKFDNLFMTGVMFVVSDYCEWGNMSKDSYTKLYCLGYSDTLLKQSVHYHYTHETVQ